MPRIADVLERESRTVDLEPGDFERLLGRRERKQRNRRIRAGAVGVIVALATGIVLVRALTSDGIPADRPVAPRPAPAASGALVYALDGDVYVAHPDGSNAVKIADGHPAEDCAGHPEYWAEGSMWSPDGRYLAYRYSDCSSPEWLVGVVISDAEGNVLAKFPTGRGWDIAWSPDSTRVAVWDNFGKTIGVYGVDGARQTQLTMPPGSELGGDFDPVWMPDGTSLRVHDVVLPLDGSAPRQLPPSYGSTCSPEDTSTHFSIAGSYACDRSRKADVTNELQGRAVDFVDAQTRPQLRLLDVATGSVTLLTEGERGTNLGVIGFSPQGDRILFWRTDADGQGSLWSIGVDGSDARLLVAGTTQGDWRPR